MKISLKQVLAVGTLAVASTSAFADIALPNSGNGELALYVLDTVSGVSYSRGLQAYTNSILTQSAIATDVANGTYTPGETVNFSLGTIQPDANLTSFLNTASAAGHAVTWTVAGGVQGNANTAGLVRLAVAVTEDADTVNNVAPSNTTLRSNSSALNGTVTQANLLIPGSTVGDGSSVYGASGAYNTGSNPLSNNFYGDGLTSQVDLGSTTNFYLFSTSGASVGADPVLFYSLNALTLSDTGVLSSAGGTAPVPVPAALWLLGSGLAGLVGIGRRKQVAAV